MAERAAAVFARARRGRVVRAPHRGVPARRAGVPEMRRARVRARARHPRRLVRLGLEPRGGAGPHRGPAVAGRPLHRGLGPVPRLVPEFAARRPRHARQAALPRRRDARLLRGRAGTQDVQVARQHDRAWRDHRQERRRDPPPLGVDGGLPRGDARRQGDPRPGGRSLPEAAQHAAHPGGEPLRLRPGHRRAAVRRAARAAPLRPLALRRGRVEGAAGVRRLRLPGRAAGREQLHHVRRERVLRQRHEGRRLHARAEVGREASRADGDVRHGRRPRPADGAHPADDGRRAVGLSAGAA